MSKVRVPTGRVILELPAGMLDDDKGDFVGTAVREVSFILLLDFLLSLWAYRYHYLLNKWICLCFFQFTFGSLFVLWKNKLGNTFCPLVSICSVGPDHHYVFLIFSNLFLQIRPSFFLQILFDFITCGTSNLVMWDVFHYQRTKEFPLDWFLHPLRWELKCKTKIIFL